LKTTCPTIIVGHVKNTHVTIFFYRGDVYAKPLPSNHKGIFTEPLPSNDKGIFTEPLPSNKRGIFIEPLPSNDRGIHRQQRDLISLLLFFQNKESSLKIENKDVKELF
jgi:hypothetical protein